MRILVFAWRDLKHPLSGGAEVYTASVAREWIKMGHSVTLFCAQVEGEPSCEISSGGYQIIRKGTRHTVYREARRFWKRKGKGRYDVVVDEVNTRPFFCSSYVKDARVLALIFQVAREVWFYEENLFVAMVGRYILEPVWLRRIRNVPIVTISKSSKASLEAYGVRNVSVVPVGYPSVTVSEHIKEQDPTLVFLGRLSANKRPDHAIRAFEIIRGTLPAAKLWVIGDGPERARLEQMAIDGVEFLGRLSESEKTKRVASAHLLLVTSVREGWGMVVTEAAIMGTPSIGYEVDGLKDSLRLHGGSVTEAKPVSLAAAALDVLSGNRSLIADDGTVAMGVWPWVNVAAAILEVSPY